MKMYVSNRHGLSSSAPCPLHPTPRPPTLATPSSSAPTRQNRGTCAPSSDLHLFYTSTLPCLATHDAQSAAYLSRSRTKRYIPQNIPQRIAASIPLFPLILVSVFCRHCSALLRPLSGFPCRFRAANYFRLLRAANYFRSTTTRLKAPLRSPSPFSPLLIRRCLPPPLLRAGIVASNFLLSLQTERALHAPSLANRCPHSNPHSCAHGSRPSFCLSWWSI